MFHDPWFWFTWAAWAGWLTTLLVAWRQNRAFKRLLRRLNPLSNMADQFQAPPSAVTEGSPLPSMWTVLSLDCRWCVSPGWGTIPIRVNALDPVSVRNAAIQLHQFMILHVRHEHPDRA